MIDDVRKICSIMFLFYIFFVGISNLCGILTLFFRWNFKLVVAIITVYKVVSRVYLYGCFYLYPRFRRSSHPLRCKQTEVRTLESKSSQALFFILSLSVTAWFLWAFSKTAEVLYTVTRQFSEVLLKDAVFPIPHTRHPMIGLLSREGRPQWIIYTRTELH